MMEIWSLHYHDCCEGWTFFGLFSTKEKAEAYRDARNEDLGSNNEDFKIEREVLDVEY